MIKSIDFKFMSPKMIKDIAALKIDQPELYDPDGYPIDGGLADLHLGVVDPGLKCRTCGGSIGQCLGHFGYLELTKPIIHPLYGKKIYMILVSTCRKCSRVLMDPENIKKLENNPLPELYRKKLKKCHACGEKQKDISFAKPTSFREGNEELTAEAIRQRLEQISDEDLKILKVKGSRPEWLIFTILPIPPVTVRPSITLETGERSEDDLTHKLVDVVRINERLRKNLELGAPDFIIEDIWELLQYHVSTLMDNEIFTLPPARHRSGRSLKTLVQRLSKKEGRFRGNLSGKRVNFSARTVISPDPMISISDVGVPIEIAKELTVPVKANESNLSHLKEIILNGPNKHPGANYLIRPDGIRKKITDENSEELAEETIPGYTVERHLDDGDITLMNRQPSLHRMSIMAHRARIMPYRTLRISLGVTIPYNADFDGDEMNIHVPQTEEAQTEAEMLMAVENHIISPRYGRPIISCKHDHITGTFLLTNDSTKIDKKRASMLLFSIGIEDFESKESYTGKEIFSMVLPEDLDVKFKTSEGDEVEIKKGKLIKGIIDENALGENKGKLIDIIHNNYGGKKTRDFIDMVSRLSLEYLTSIGFSISVDDETINEKSKKKITDLLDEYEKSAKKIIQSNSENVEEKILQLGGETSNSASSIVKNSLPMNSAVIMAVSGARGSYVNLTQICGFVGQEALEGNRINRGYSNRTLSHFKKNDIGLASRGFVRYGYKDGLDPFGMFFDAMNSRENLMDKSLHTRHSGYMERRLVNALQDLRVEYDGTVRDSKGKIIQFIAGQDGIDPAKSQDGKIEMERLL